MAQKQAKTMRAAAIDQLRDALPEELQGLVAGQLQAELRAQVSALRAAGGNPAAARLAGVPVNRTIVVTYVVSAGLSR